MCDRLWLLPDVLLGGLALGLSRLPAVQVTANMLFSLAVFLVTLLPATCAVAPYYRRLRGIEAKERAGPATLPGRHQPDGKQRRSIDDDDPSKHLERQTDRRGLAGRRQQVEEEYPQQQRHQDGEHHALRRRLDALLTRAGVRVREIRVLDTRSQKVANALIMGPCPACGTCW